MNKIIISTVIPLLTFVIVGLMSFNKPTIAVPLNSDEPNFKSTNINYNSKYRVEKNPYEEGEMFYTTIEPPTEVTTIQHKTKSINYSSNYSNKLNQLDEISKDLIGTPYVWGGTTPYKGMDCSGYTQYVMKQLGYNIPRVSRDQSKYGTLIPRTSLRKGDLLFFDTTNPRDASDIKTPTQELQYAKQAEEGYKPTNVSHVGIYMGDGVMLHASSGDGIITYADLNSTYYKNRFLHARRVIK